MFGSNPLGGYLESKITLATHLFNPNGNSPSKAGDAKRVKTKTAAGIAISKSRCSRFPRMVPIMPASWWRSRSAS